MNCDNCDASLNFGQREYVDRKENLGVVLCYACRNGTGQERVESDVLY